jgi:MoxR-like ATPase
LGARDEPHAARVVDRSLRRHTGSGSRPLSVQAPAIEPEELRRITTAVEERVGEVIVGQRAAIRGVLLALLAGGHALLEGVPGLGKTTMASTFADALGLERRRIQFTPDLLPADITGTTVLTTDGDTTDLRFQRGPIFAHVVLADEINRAAPRTQSALLEAMQEHQVTVATTTHRLPDPFFVLATQNPVEMHGTYPLPEAELDRFLLKLEFSYPGREELNALVTRTATHARRVEVEAVADAETLRSRQALVREVPAASAVVDYATRLVLALQPGDAAASELVRTAVRLGPSPRGAQALTLTGRANALIEGRMNLSFEDVRAVAPDALRHRLGLSFDAERQGITADAVVADARERVPEEA